MPQFSSLPSTMQTCQIKYLRGVLPDALRPGRSRWRINSFAWRFAELIDHRLNRHRGDPQTLA